MRLVSWNCKSAFHRKHRLVCELKPDVLIIPECEKLESSSLNFGELSIRSFQWFGTNPKKGVGVFSFGDYEFEVLPFFNPEHRWVIPLRVSGKKSFLLLAVWAMPNAESGSYVQPIVEALEEYGENLDSEHIYIMGDFNANYIFDRPSRIHRFQDLVSDLSQKGIRSLFHEQHGAEHGKEDLKTFFMYHHADKGYHIDYIFGGKNVQKESFDVRIGSFSEWHKHSDHVPLIYTEWIQTEN
jgi:exonuclease III